MAVIDDRLAWLDRLTLEKGSHSPDGAACVMEAVAYVAGEPWSDHPKCASPILTSFLIGWNDALPDDERQALKPFIPRIVGTNTGPADEETRAWMLTDWLARECAPAWLRLAGLTAKAEHLEALAPLADAASAKLAQPSLDVAKRDSDAAWAAAWAAARAAARDAAWDAAWAAAWAAARDAARAAARDAAWAAAENGQDYDGQYAAAYTATKRLVEERLAPTTAGLQASALLLLDRLIAVSQTEEHP